MECCWALCIGMHALWMICSSLDSVQHSWSFCVALSQYKLLDDGSLGLSTSSEGFLACHYTPRRPAWTHCLCQPNPSYIGRDACRTVGGNNVRIKGIIVSLIEHPSYSYLAMDAVFEKRCMQKDLQTDTTVWKASGRGLYLQSSLCLCMSIRWYRYMLSTGTVSGWP